MLQSMMEGYLETLAGYISDEDKLVTYKWLSKELEVHVNVAKQVLEEYWKKNKSDSKEPLVATVMLIGYLKDDGMRVEVVKEENLEVAKDKYSKIISQHLYSLQKSLPDLQLLAETDRGDVKFGAIKCEKSNLLSDEELFARRWGSNANFQVTTSRGPESSSEKHQDSKKAEIKKKSTLDGLLKPVSEINGISTHSKEKDKEQAKPEDKHESKKGSPKSKLVDKKGLQSKKPVQSTSTGFKNLFGKVAAANQNKSPPSSSKNNENNVNGDVKSNGKVGNGSPMDVDEEKVEKMTSNGSISNGITKLSIQKSDISEKSSGSPDSQDSKQENRRRLVEIDEQKSNKDVKSKQSSKNRGNKRQRSQESSKSSAKKRKRIIAVESSDDEVISDDDRDVFNDSPPRETVSARQRTPSPPRVQQIGGKRKVRKAVDQTFKDEDGFLVTKKVFVYESASDEDIPAVEAVKEVKDVKELKKSSPDLKTSKVKTSNKQTTLMTFFKKA